MDEAFGHTPRTRRPLINITPLVDVMLLLLIFFMATSTFKDMRALDLQLPQAVTSDMQARRPHEVVVAQDGAVAFNGVTVDHDALRRALRVILMDKPEAPVVLRADKRVAYEHVVALLDLMRAEGVDQLILPVDAAEPSAH